jgi:hypothetical protein
MHFIHNKINVSLEKQEISLPEALSRYRAKYKPKMVYLAEKINMRKHYIYAGLILVTLFLIYTFYE